MERFREAGESFKTVNPITVSSSAIGLTEADIANKNLAIITMETITATTDTMRMKVGSDPTTSNGDVFNNGDTLELDSADDLAAVRFIATGSDVKLNWHVGVG